MCARDAAALARCNAVIADPDCAADAKFATNELVPVDMRDVSALLAAEVRSDE